MKRIQSGCLLQSIQFELKDELETFKFYLDKKKIKYVIESEQVQPDGSVVIKLKRQYIKYGLGDYLK